MKTVEKPDYWLVQDVKIDLTVTKEQISDILTTAFEGGSNYWIEGVAFDPTCEVSTAEGEHVFKGMYASDYVGLGGSLWIAVKDDNQPMICEKIDPDVVWSNGRGDVVKDGCVVLKLTADKVANGFAEYVKMKKLWYNLSGLDLDAGDCDVILQLTLFGRIVYG